jgi:hypothetical protein
MTQNVHHAPILTGNFVGSSWDASPFLLTPYAQAIADAYPIQIPWYLSIPITTKASAIGPNAPLFPQFYGAQSRPQQYDVLILGFSLAANFNDWFTARTVNRLSIQITHQETGIPWVEPIAIGYAPLLSLAGLSVTPPPGGTLFPRMPIMRLPEAFFFPRNTLLKYQWTQMTTDSLPPVTVVLTFHGIQLVMDANKEAPRYVTMPDKTIVKVGSRVPWFGVVPYGRRGAVGRFFGDFTLPTGEQYVQFLPPSDCNVELHDVYANFTATFIDSQNYTVKLNNLRAGSDWTPGFTPSMAFAGDELKANPAAPFTKPYVIELRHRLSVVEQNNAIADTPNACTLTFRGVRRCQY